MTTKTTEKREPRQHASPSKDEIRMAYEAHTLAQMIYGQMTAGPPWAGQMPMTPGFEPTGHMQPFRGLEPPVQSAPYWGPGCAGYCAQPEMPQQHAPFPGVPYAFGYGFFPRW